MDLSEGNLQLQRARRRGCGALLCGRRHLRRAAFRMPKTRAGRQILRGARLLAGNVKDLINAPITYFDGRNDNYESPPRETRHLRTIAIGQASTPSQLAGIQKSAERKKMSRRRLFVRRRGEQKQTYGIENKPWRSQHSKPGARGDARCNTTSGLRGRGAGYLCDLGRPLLRQPRLRAIVFLQSKKDTHGGNGIKFLSLLLQIATTTESRPYEHRY